MYGFIHPEKLKNINKIYYHGSCPDGIIAREIMRLFFKKTVEYIPFYFTPLKKIPANTLFIDCSPNTNQLRECLLNGCLIAEHHDSFAKLALAEHLEEHYPGQILIGETEKGQSGAILACELVGGISSVSKTVKCIAELIAIGDTWQKNHPEFEYARMLGKFIVNFGNDFKMPLEDLYMNTKLITDFGAAALKKQIGFAKGSIRHSFTVNGISFKLAFINTLNMSDAAEHLRTTEDTDIVIGYECKTDFDGSTITIYSLRSKENGFNCADFCKANGGGGHKAAAGFNVPMDLHLHPIMHFSDLLTNWAYTQRV